VERLYDELCVSSDNDNSKSLEENKDIQGQVILIAPRWPMRAWYSSLLDLLVDLPRTLPYRQDLLSQIHCQNPDKFNLMAWNSLRAEGFLERTIETIIQSRAAGTRAGYNAKWSVFICWCGQKSLDPHSTSVMDICDFLQDKLEGGIQWQTLRGYVAAISACHHGFTVHSLGKDKRVIQFLKGAPASC
jgi:hypothetical protein